jgi:hypothetical protein
MSGKRGNRMPVIASIWQVDDKAKKTRPRPGFSMSIGDCGYLTTGRCSRR